VKSHIFRNNKNSRNLLAPRRYVGLLAIASLAMAQLCPAQDAALPTQAASVADAATLPGSFSSISRGVTTGKTLHVTLGHSIFIDTKSRLRRVYVADPTIVSSVTLSPTQIIVTAMSPGISSLTLLDEAGQAQSYLVSSDLDIDGLRTAMSESMRSDAVKVDGSAGRVTLSGIVGSQAAADAAAKLAGMYSKEVANALVVVPSHPKQVRLEVRILEVDRSKLLQLGINLFNPGGNTNYLATSTSAQFPSAATLSQGAAGTIGTLAATNPLSFLLYSAKLNLGATIQDLQTKQVLQILAEPNITTISGEKASFLSGGEFPFPVVQPGSGAGSAPVVSITFRPFGVKVDFTPIVNEDGTIRLKVAPEVSALDYSNAVSISGITVPALSTRRAETEVELRSNQSFAISGLLDQRTTDIMSKNPGAASIPILGNLFKSKNANHSTTELIVVVTPTVVDPLLEPTEPDQPTMPIPTLNSGPFDKSLGKNLNPHPEAPPINPDHPPYGNVPAAVQPPAPQPAAPKTGSTEEAAPKAVPQSTQGAISSAPAIASVGEVAPIAASRVAAVLDDSAAGAPTTRSSVQLPVTGGRPNIRAGAASSMVEIMALSHESDADAMVAALKRHGYSVAVNRSPGDELLHLDVGPFASRKDAVSMRQRLLVDGYNAAIK
jgi:pilus assembly protein CpaC